MSVHVQTINPVPEETARVARLAFPKGNRYLTMRDEIGTIYTDQDFADLFSTYGQPAVSPWRLALICVLQFLEDLTDRQAAEAVRSRLDWQDALGLELTDPGFDFSVLSCHHDACPSSRCGANRAHSCRLASQSTAARTTHRRCWFCGCQLACD